MAAVIYIISNCKKKKYQQTRRSRVSFSQTKNVRNREQTIFVCRGKEKEREREKSKRERESCWFCCCCVCRSICCTGIYIYTADRVYCCCCCWIGVRSQERLCGQQEKVDEQGEVEISKRRASVTQLGTHKILSSPFCFPSLSCLYAVYLVFLWFNFDIAVFLIYLDHLVFSFPNHSQSGLRAVAINRRKIREKMCVDPTLHGGCDQHPFKMKTSELCLDFDWETTRVWRFYHRTQI